jgi:K+-sensing histidine kinase KdpD
MDSGTRTGEPRNDVSALRSTKSVGQWLWQQQWSKARGYGIAALAVTVAILVKSALQPWIDRESPFLLFLAAVMVSAWHGGAGPGVFASVLAALASDYFFLAPYGSFGDWNRIQVLRLGQFLLEGTVISLLAGGLRHARSAAEKAAAGERSAREEADSARAELAAAYEKEILYWLVKWLWRPCSGRKAYRT